MSLIKFTKDKENASHDVAAKQLYLKHLTWLTNQIKNNLYHYAIAKDVWHVDINFAHIRLKYVVLVVASA